MISQDLPEVWCAQCADQAVPGQEVAGEPRCRSHGSDVNALWVVQLHDDESTDVVLVRSEVDAIEFRDAVIATYRAAGAYAPGITYYFQGKIVPAGHGAAAGLEYARVDQITADPAGKETD